MLGRGDSTKGKHTIAVSNSWVSYSLPKCNMFFITVKRRSQGRLLFNGGDSNADQIA